MKTRILFSTNNQPASVLIRFGTWSEYSHCDIVNPNPNERTIIGATGMHGVIEYPFDKRIADSTKWRIFEVPAPESLVWDYAKKQVGKKYDWLGCMGIAVHRDWQEDDKWFCSELVAKAVLDAGLPLLNPYVRLNRITPQMLLTSPLLE